MEVVPLVDIFLLSVDSDSVVWISPCSPDTVASSSQRFSTMFKSGDFFFFGGGGVDDSCVVWIQICSGALVRWVRVPSCSNCIPRGFSTME